MQAAVVTSYGTLPSYQEFPTPQPQGDDEVLVDVVAAGLHPRVRSQAMGSHYTSTDELPLVPGVDGVGRAPDGSLRYFILHDTVMGSMAEQTVVDLRRSIVLPEGTDPVTVAAAMNPAMSSWLALRQRVVLQPGQSVLVLAATGNAGQLAVQVAKHLGAGQVIAAGRNPDKLAALVGLGADLTVSLEGEPDEVAQRLGQVAGDVDVVLDYLWGPPTAAAMLAVAMARSDRGKPLAWVEIGSLAGLTAAIPSAALRAARLQIVGSGQGSVPTRDILAELPNISREVSKGTFQVNAQVVPLRDVEAAWARTESDQRIVIAP